MNPLLIEQISETLAGRVDILELTPFLYSEVASHGVDLDTFWILCSDCAGGGDVGRGIAKPTLPAICVRAVRISVAAPQMTPWSIMASATFMKPAMFAPFV